MASPALAMVTSEGSKFRRYSLYFAAMLLIILVALGVWFYAVARRALPQLDGQVAVKGLSAPVKIIRDAQGVPRISASSLDDLFFAQGYVTAQDRLWQMDATRRYAGGELSEIFGDAYLDHDRQQRVLGLRHVAEQAVPSLPAQDRRFLEAYARGVNAYMTGHPLSAEFHVLGYTPLPWKVQDSILIGINMAQMLNYHIVGDTLAREKVMAKLGPQLAADLYPETSYRDRPPTQLLSLDQFAPEPVRNARHRRNHRREDNDDGASLLPPPAEFVAGSNNWVISGEHTASGKPLLSNDMHLGHQIPNVWYEAHLTGPNFDVAGVTLPGLPFVLVGHNQRIAWGFTNVGPQVTDLFIENVNAGGQYQTPEGWKPLEHRREVIKVKRGSDVVVDVAITRHGPIITPLIDGEKRNIALKWNIYDPELVQVPFFDVNSAQNWDEFRRAFSRFSAPSQNIVYGDLDGHIGYFTSGKIPVRAADNNMLPVSGADNAHEWTGYIPFDQLPSSYDPPSGVIATANGRIIPDNYPFLITHDWMGPERTERIYHVLQADKHFTTWDMLALQTDIYSAHHVFLAQRLAYAIDHASKTSDRAKQAADILRGWDGTASIDSPAPTIVAAASDELKRLLLEPKLGHAGDDPRHPTGWRQYHWFMNTVWLENTLIKQPAPWLPAGFSNYDGVLARALENAVNSSEAPKDLTSWKWGQQHPLDIEHPIYRQLPIISRWAGPGRFPQSGNGLTVKQVGSGFGPSERMTVDFSNLDESTLNIVNGESGNIMSPHFDDQWNAWYNGETFPLPFSSAAVEKARVHELTLVP